MLRRTVQGCVELATELADEVGKRVAGTAAGLLERSGIDLAEVERKLGGQFPPSVKSLQTLAGEAVTAGRAGVDVAVGVARSEVEKAFERVGDQVTKVGVVLAYLESKLREVEEEGGPAGRADAGPQAAAPRADGLFGHGWERADGATEPIVAERVEVDEASVEAGQVPAKAPAKKTPAEKAAAKKTPPRKATRTEKPPAAKQAAAKRTGTKKTVVKKTAATAEQPPAKAAAKRGTTAKKTTVRRSTSGKGGDAGDV